MKIFKGVILRGEMKLIVGSHSILRRKHSDAQTVWLFNVTKDTKEENDLRYQSQKIQSLKFKS